MMLWEHRLSQTYVANRLDISQSALSRSLRGERRWRLAEVIGLAEMLGVTPNELLPMDLQPTDYRSRGAGWVPPVRLERTTRGLKVRCYYQLSYRGREAILPHGKRPGGCVGHDAEQVESARTAAPPQRRITHGRRTTRRRLPGPRSSSRTQSRDVAPAPVLVGAVAVRVPGCGRRVRV